MKKIVLSISVLLSAMIMNAQIRGGSIFLGGDLSGYTQKTKTETGNEYRGNGVTISPVFGKFIKDNIVIGGNLGFSLADLKNDLGIDTKGRTYQAGVFARKYKNVGNSGFYIFGQAGLNASYLKQEADDPNNVYEDNIQRTTVGINAYPGISFAVSKRFHLETGFNNLISLSYFNEKRDESPGLVGYTSNGFSLSTSLSNMTSSLYLGFRMLLSK